MVRKMKDKLQRGRRALATFVLGILVGCACLGSVKISSLAEDKIGVGVLVNAQLLSTGKSTYDIAVTMQNMGTDWEGTARLYVGEKYRTASAYDTMISLPQGSTKQFTVRVPKDDRGVDAGIKVALLDKKSKEVASWEFDYFFRSESYGLSMGILSDSYSDLTYLDMGGNTLYFQQNDQPIRLEELNQDNLKESLDRLTLLVIDNYNTGVLTEEEMEAIENWNQDGGILIVGTGSRGEETLAGFEDGYLGVKFKGVHQMEEDNDAWTSSNFYLDESKLTMADIVDKYAAYQSSLYGVEMSRPVGDGAAGILPYSLTEIGKLGKNVYREDVDQTIFVRDLLDDVCGCSSSRYYNQNDYDYSYLMARMQRGIGRSDMNLSFGALKALVVLYVIFAGPVLYLILRLLKKRELYWGAVPVSAVVGILLVFLAGRGFEVVSTKVYSVTVENLSGREESRAYLYCYDANHKEWDLKLADKFDYAGGYENNNYNNNGWEDGVYYHHVKMEGDTLSFGIRPSGGFEDCFFVAGAAGSGASSVGTIKGEGIKSVFSTIEGRVTNETDRDFAYFAVHVDDRLCVYENLPAGESVDLGTLAPVYTNNGSYSYSNSSSYYSMNDYIYSFMDQLYDDHRYDEIGAAAAMGVGLCATVPKMKDDCVVIVGLTEDWDRTVNDNCSEVSYGCLYTIQ